MDRLAEENRVIQVQLFTYRYDDTDTVMNELEEFYPYVEMPSVAKGPDNFKGSFDGGE